MPIRNNTKAMTINRQDLAFDVGGVNVGATITNLITDSVNYLQHTTGDLTLSSNSPTWIDCLLSADIKVYLPTTATAGKIFNIRNISTADYRVRIENYSGHGNDYIFQGLMMSYIFDGTNWNSANNRLLDFGLTGAYNSSRTDASFGLGRAYVDRLATYGIAFGLDSYCGGSKSLAFGYGAKANNDNQFVRGGNQSQLDRLGEEGRNNSYADNTHHFSKRISWAGIIDTAPGWHEIFLQKATPYRLELKDNSTLTGTFRLNMKRLAGGYEGYSTIRTLTLNRNNGVASTSILNNTSLATYNADPTKMDLNIVANTILGTIDVFCSGGLTVGAYDLLITAEFDFIETIL